MTIEYTYTPVKVSGDGATAAFDFAFTIYAKSDVIVQLINKTTDAVSTLTLGVEYNVSIDLVNVGGTITFTAGNIPANTHWIFIYSDVPDTQPTSFPLGDKLKEEEVEQMGDRQVILLQQLLYDNDKKFGFSISETSNPPDVPALSAGYLYTEGTTLTWKAMAITETQYNGVISRGLDAAKPASPTIGDLYFATDVNTMYRCIVNGSWTNDMATGLINGLFLGNYYVRFSPSSGDSYVDNNVLGGKTLIRVSDATARDTTAISVDKDGIALENGVRVDEFSSDGTLAGDSDVAVPTEKAVKTYVDARIFTIGTATSIDTYVSGGTGASLAANTSYTATRDGIIKIAAISANANEAVDVRIEGTASSNMSNTSYSTAASQPLSASTIVKSGKVFYYGQNGAGMTGVTITFQPIKTA